ncbi:MAG: hypothetical protein A3F18_03940 [Legionellales bacterium RIFCSPHIGHO2_12_FULL_37_14]|nr:MAG: hypothetical protein A3F18_03940 [Legionellales bacterium RIFCSPHIGHO2_12_FULL_37_14]
MKVINTDSKTFFDSFGLSFGKMSRQDELILINKDLVRNRFINTNGKNFSDLTTMWNTQSENNDYNQGNIDGSAFHIINTKFFVENMSNNTTPKLFLDQNGEPLLSVEFGSPNFCGSETKFLSFAYYDVDPKDPSKTIPCALYIAYSPLNPHFWSMGLIRNTVGAPKDREVSFICNPEVVGGSEEDKDLVDTEKAVTSLLSKVNTPKISNYMQGILNQDGTLNVDKLAALNTLVTPSMSAEAQQRLEDSKVIENAELEAKQQRLTRLEELQKLKEMQKQEELQKQKDLQIQEKKQQHQAQESKEIRNSSLMIAGVIIASVAFALSLFFTGGLTALVPAVAALAATFGPIVYAAAVAVTTVVAAAAISLVGAIGYGIRQLINYFSKEKTAAKHSTTQKTDPTSPSASQSEEMQDSSVTLSKLSHGRAEAPPAEPQNSVDLLQPNAPEEKAPKPAAPSIEKE